VYSSGHAPNGVHITKGKKMTTQITESQIQILASIVEGDVVSFKAINAKSFGKKHTVVKVTRDTEYDVTIWTLPINDTRVQRFSHRGYAERAGSYGQTQMRVFYPYNQEQTAFLIRKESN
jgi:hypothetical protein